MTDAPIQVSIHILHNPKPDRKAALRRLLGSLDPSLFVLVEDGPGPECAFNERRWRRAVSDAKTSGTTHTCFLDDDVLVCPHFAEKLRAIVTARPNDVIALHTSLPGAMDAYTRDEHWLTTDDGVLGPANVWPIALLEDFLAWRSSDALTDDAIEHSSSFGSDVLAGLWHVATGRKVYHPVPTITDHDLTLETNFAGNETTPGRSTTCNWRSGLVRIPDSWEQAAPIRHVGGWFKGMANIKRRYLRSASETVPAVNAKRPSIFIALPTYGGIEGDFMLSLIALLPYLAERGIDATLCQLNGESLITRGRNRLVHRFLATDCMGLLFLDVDLKFDPATVCDMVLSGLPVVGAPYTVKSIPGRLACTVAQVEREGKRQRVLHGRYVMAHDVPTGCLFIRRETFDTLKGVCPTFECDLEPSRPTLTAFFDTSIEDEADGRRRLLSEDYHFARVCQTQGISCWLDTEAKLTHIGKFGFTAPSLREQWDAAKAAKASDAATATGGLATVRARATSLPPGGGASEPGNLPHFYESIEGNFTFADLYEGAVAQAKPGSVFVEVGTWKGRSAAFMAVEIANSKKPIDFFCIDWWDDTPTSDHINYPNAKLADFNEAMRPVAQCVTAMKGDSAAMADKFGDRSVDFCFIDAGHDYESVKRDIAAWLPKIRVGGILAGHDYIPDYPGVMRAVDEAFPGRMAWAVGQLSWLVVVDQKLADEANTLATTRTRPALGAMVRMPGNGAAAIALDDLAAKQRAAKLDVTYSKPWFAEHTQHRAGYHAIGQAILDVLPKFTSALDVGCGAAFVIEELAKKGIDVRGIDGTANALGTAPRELHDRILLADITTTNPSEVEPADVIICTEVAEHIDARHADTLVSFLAGVADGGRIVFSAAEVGQGGHDHVNEQPMSYWLEKFGAHGYARDDARTNMLRGILAHRAPTMPWFAKTTVVLQCAAAEEAAAE